MLWRWMPWKFLIGRAARAYGIMDPVKVLARLRSFSQPSEVQEPMELLRAGIVFQARGLINARVIQYNLDWEWPYWVQRQFGPEDPSFVPRSFSFGHVNLTQRSWTAVGRADLPIYAIVDPRGLVTPMFNGWSLDFWLIDGDGNMLMPSRQKKAYQHVHLRPRYTVGTRTTEGASVLVSEVSIRMAGQTPMLRMAVTGQSPKGGYLVVAVRPYNPEGISFVEHLSFMENEPALRVNKKAFVILDRPPDRLHFSDYRQGDVYQKLLKPPTGVNHVHCPLGLATAAAMFSLDGDKATKTARLRLSVPLGRELRRERNRSGRPGGNPVNGCKALLPDDHFQFLFDNAVHTLMMLSAGDIFPGPFTYKRFWFRDACLMMQALLCLGAIPRAHRLIAKFMSRQKRDGYFQSQQGEWDSNGQVLWILSRYRKTSGVPLPSAWYRPILRAARWILAKRTPRNNGQAHAGLMPAGFSAEHLGPNDYYFWDDFWSAAGLKAAAGLMDEAGIPGLDSDLSDAAEQFQADIFRCVEHIDPHRALGGIPASPYRRMDAGAIGSMVADYPLQLTTPGDPRIMHTLEYLLAHHFIRGGFFQDMIHSGINAYLTLDLAQSLLRAGDARYLELIQSIAALASPTGNWPEAIHPFSGGGAMGDGQHGWAAAEWIMMVRNLFVREEGERLIIGSGVPPQWLDGKLRRPIEFGPTWTAFGSTAVRFSDQDGAVTADVRCRWHDDHLRAPVDICVPGFEPRFEVAVDAGTPVQLVPTQPRVG